MAYSNHTAKLNELCTQGTTPLSDRGMGFPERIEAAIRPLTVLITDYVGDGVGPNPMYESLINCPNGRENSQLLSAVVAAYGALMKLAEVSQPVQQEIDKYGFMGALKDDPVLVDGVPLTVSQRDSALAKKRAMGEILAYLASYLISPEESGITEEDISTKTAEVLEILRQ